ncbi:Beta-glucanase (modular protein) [Verrucomicrobia bacterium]|nr:Beta-glucanase (modular protein) [Verrucomicrobiota bacterium]
MLNKPRMGLVFSLAVGAGLNGAAQNVPPGAAVLNYTLRVINDRPTSAEIAPGSNGHYNWFSGQWWETPPPLTDYSTVSNVLVLSLGGDLVSTPRDFSAGALPVLSGSNGFYVEFEVQLSDTNQDHWPAVWLMPVEHNAQAQDRYPGDPPGFERWMELDVDEGGWGPGLLGTVHSWSGIWPNYTNVSNPNNLSPVALDRSQKHTLGGSYDPRHQMVTWWVDGQRQMSAVSPYVPAIAAKQHFYLILSAQTHGKNIPYSMYVSGVRAYVPVALELLMPSVEGSSFSFNWSAVSGQVYQVQYSTDLRAANWTNWGNPITASNSIVSISDTITNTQRFYRVVVSLGAP